jgi:hypothetical protein
VAEEDEQDEVVLTGAQAAAEMRHDNGKEQWLLEPSARAEEG